MRHITLLITLLMHLTARGQQVYKCDSIKSYWILEKGNSFFTIRLSGKISEQERESVIAVNNFALQYVIVEKKDFLKEGSDNDDLKVLTNYVLREAEHMTELFRQKLNIHMQKAPLSSDKTILIWFFEMPSNVSQEVKHQVFVNMVIGDKIFGLSSSQFADQELDDVKGFLMDVISTLKQVRNKNDLEKLCEQ